MVYTEFVPSTGPGPVVIVLSGSAGPDKVAFVANDLVRLGYYVILADGEDVYGRSSNGGDSLRKLILMARGSTHARPGKVAVIGLSRGGTGVLLYASAMSDLVAVSVAFYPGTSSTWIADKEAVISRLSVPTLAFVGEADFGPLGFGCCTAATIQVMAASAKERGVPFESHIYPGVGHDFNWPTVFSSADQRNATEDSWRRTLIALRRYLGPAVNETGSR